MPFPGSGFVNGILVCPNVDFRQVQPTVGQMTQNGQLLIGANAPPYIRAATPTNGTNITWVLGAGTIRANLTGTTNHTIQLGNAAGSLTSATALTNGQLLIGSTGNDPSAAALTAGTGIGIVNAAGSITINSVGGGLTWTTQSASTALLVNNGFIAIAPGGALSFSLPATSAVGDVIALTLDDATSWTITQGANQRIRLGSSQTSLGVGGSLASTAAGDTVVLVCRTANLIWQAYSVIGNITVV